MVTGDYLKHAFACHADLSRKTRSRKPSNADSTGIFRAFPPIGLTRLCDITKLLSAPLDVKRTELKTHDEGVKLYSVEIACPGTRPATGYLTVPIGKTLDAKFPAKVHAQGYGAGVHSPPTGRQSRTCIHFRLNAHG